jgi:glycosyltransferase involved in cell wall biosynthesis
MHEIKNPIKICVITSWFPSRTHPNLAPFVYNFVKNLGRSGVHVSVIVPNSDHDEKITEYEFMTIYRVAKVFPLFSILELINKLKPDIIHVHAPNFFSSNAIIVAKLKHIPIVATVHRAEIDKVSTLIHVFRKIALSKFNKIIAVSDFTKSLAMKTGISEDNVIVIYNSCDETLFLPGDKLRARQKIQLPLDKKIILYVGNLIKLKGVDVLIKSCKLLDSNTSDFLVLLVGNGEDREEFESLVNSYGLGENIKFLNWLEQKDLPDCYAAADIFVLPSLTEGHSVALLEAMSSRLPVIASMVGGNRETVEDGVNGFLFERGNSEVLAEKLKRMLANGGMCNQMALRSYETYLKKFSVKNQMEKYLKLYHSILIHSR